MNQSTQDIMLVDAITEQKRRLPKHDVLLEDFRELGALVIESFPPSVFRTEALRALLIAATIAYDEIWRSYGLVAPESSARSRLEDLASNLSPRFWDDPSDEFGKTTVGQLAFRTALLASRIASCMFTSERNAQCPFVIPGYFGSVIREGRLDALRKLNEFDRYIDLLICRHIKNTGHSENC